MQSGILRRVELGSVEDFRWCWGEFGVILEVGWVEVICWRISEVRGWIWTGNGRELEA